ncbi:MAG TPA: bifunctional helix-turn-helix transcriptional regulator/GNAT family N-acetyltransferase [Paracoccaceae bacterium]|nr:bifunctional helix-turn-helix transcriptional regulator/GNAT family N-acetyltransferase [Paracoccaceae bacterium]
MDAIDRLRAFNRFYTCWLGVLGRGYLGAGLSLGEVRILHDLAEAAARDAPPWRARGLAAALGMDEAFLSRALRGFETRGWITRAPDPGDARQRDILLTDAGRAEAAELRTRSRTALAQMLLHLDTDAVAGIADRLEAVQARLTGGGTPADLRALAPGDAGWVIGRHGALYHRDEGYDARFEALVARIVAEFLDRTAAGAPTEAGWIAWSGARRVGSIFCMAEGAAAAGCARLRLFLIEPDQRGTGLAQRMMDTCLTFGREAGYRRIVLWTHESHAAAGRLYARNGFRRTERTPGHAFGQAVVDEVWERTL